MDFRVKIFLAVARHRQLTEASRQLNMAASTVSEHVSALEVEIDAVLFVRTNRGMRLTEAGQRFFQAAQIIEGQWHSALREVPLIASGTHRIDLAASQTAIELFLPPPLGRFRERFPEVPIHLTMANPSEVLQQVAAGLVDMGLVEGGMVHGSLQAVNLWHDALVLVVSQRHPVAAEDRVMVDTLVDLDWILREPGSGTRATFERALGRAGWSTDSLKIIMELSSLRAILSMVANNVGVSVVSRAIAESGVLHEGIRAITIDGLALERHIQLVRRRHGAHSTAAGSLMQMLVEDAESKDRHRLRAEPR